MYVLPPPVLGGGVDRGVDTEQPPLCVRLLERDAIGGRGSKRRSLCVFVLGGWGFVLHNRDENAQRHPGSDLRARGRIQVKGAFSGGGACLVRQRHSCVWIAASHSHSEVVKLRDLSPPHPPVSLLSKPFLTTDCFLHLWSNAFCFFVETKFT